MINSIINFVSSFKTESKTPVLPKPVLTTRPKLKNLGKRFSSNVRGIFDTLELCLYMDSGEVIQISPKIRKRTNNRNEISLEVQKWAAYRGLIRSGEVIAIR